MTKDALMAAPPFSTVQEDNQRLRYLLGSCASRLDSVGGTDPYVSIGEKAKFNRVDGLVREIQLSASWITGVVNFSFAPRNLVTLNLSKNRLQGGVDLTSLPLTLREMIISENFFSGPIDLCCLPNSLEYLDLSVNRLSGAIDIGRLPPKLHTLLLHANQLTSVTTRSYRKRLPEKPGAKSQEIGSPRTPVGCITDLGEDAVSTVGASAPSFESSDEEVADGPLVDWDALPKSLKNLHLGGNPMVATQVLAVAPPKELTFVWNDEFAKASKAAASSPRP